MGTEGNGSTADKFDTGLVAPSDQVEYSALWKTHTGRHFITDVLQRHRHGDWGSVSPGLFALNALYASDSAVAAGGIVTGIYSIPEDLSKRLPGEHLVVITTAIALIPFLDPGLRIPVTFVLFREELS